MPQVPIVQGRSVQDAPLQGGYQQAADVGAPTRALAKGLGEASDAVDKIVERNNNDVAWRTEAQVKTDFAKFDADLRKQSQGRGAAGYADKVNQWWTDRAKETGGTLNRAQRDLISRSLLAAQTQAYQGALNHQNAELDKSEADAFNASQLAEIQRAAASGDPAVAATSSQLLRERNAQRATAKGWTPEVLAEMNTKATTALHVNMIQDLQQKDPQAALTYFNANKGEIDGTRHAEIQHGLTVAAAGSDGIKAADDIWTKLGPKADGQPVELDKMEAAAREKYGNDKPRLEATMAQIKERAAAQNASEKERAAANTNTVMLAYQKGAGLAKLMTMPEFTALPGSEQVKIRQHIEDRAYASTLRANANDARSDAAEAREQRRLQRQGFAGYLAYSDPAVLSTMSEAQVQALLPSLGNELTNHLMEKKRALVKSPLGEAEARIDKQDFDHVADQMGLKPFAKKTDEEKANLGELQYRVEQMIYGAQQAKGKALTRDEKNELMRQEMARTVKVSGWFSNTDTPVIQLSKDDIKNVIVPDTDRTQITAAMQAMYQRTKSPQYAPTDANLRRFYLLSKSRAAKLLPTDAK